VQDGWEEEELLQPQQNALDALVGRGLEAVNAAQATVKALQEAKETGEFNGKDGVDGKDGTDGKDGIDGKDGYTPVKGVDYYTEAERQAFQEALEARTRENFAATAILCTVRGDHRITVTDAAEYPLQGLTLYGTGEGGNILRLYIPEQCPQATVLRQPADVTAPVGASVPFSVVPGGPNVSCKWEYSPGGGKGWYSSSFAGSATQEMTVPVTEVRNGFLYRCRITDANGTVVFSEPARLTVDSQLLYGPAAWNTEAAAMTLALPQPLSGTPADSGNYTDPSGRSWQSAVLDLAGGTFTPWGEESVALEADLSQLRCSKGSFTLLNDLGAGMTLAYVADPKTYIDQKFAALAAAML